MDDVETLRAKTTAQQHPRFLQFMIEMKEYMTDETDCLVLWDVWCTFYELSLQGKSVHEIVSTPVERHTTKENINKFFSPDTYRKKKKNAQDQVAAAGTTETSPEHPEHPCPTTPKDSELPEVPLLTAAAQRRLGAEKAESSKRKGKGSKAKKDSKAKRKTKGKNARKSKRSRKGRKASRTLKAKRAMEAEDEQSRKKPKSHEEGKQQQHDGAPQLVSKDEQVILKKKPDCEISTLLRTLLVFI